MRILITLPPWPKRQTLGTLQIVDDHGEVLFGPIDCLGLADSDAAEKANNETRDPMKRMGDTPVGLYDARVTLVMSMTRAFRRSYGTFGRIVLTPKFRLDREGLQIHSGDPADEGHGYGPDPKRQLRPTNGCPRTRNEDQQSLVNFVQKQGGKMLCQVIEK